MADKVPIIAMTIIISISVKPLLLTLRLKYLERAKPFTLFSQSKDGFSTGSFICYKFSRLGASWLKQYPALLV